MIVATLFERLGRPAPTEKAKEKPEPAQLLLTWLQKWPKPTVRMNEILVYGPRPTMRKRETAIGPIETLVKHGWLVPIKTRRPDMLEWQIARRPIAHPTIAT
jgi:hypothetical protein